MQKNKQTKNQKTEVIVKIRTYSHKAQTFNTFYLNLLKTSPEYTQAGFYGKCVL